MYTYIYICQQRDELLFTPTSIYVKKKEINQYLHLDLYKTIYQHKITKALENL